MTEDETLKMALDFLMTRRMGAEAVIEALNEALAQPPLPVQPEPSSECNPQDLCAGCRCKYGAQPPLPVQETVAWDKPSDNFNEWWDSNYEDPANPFEKDSAAWWAWAGWKAAQTVQEPVAWLYPEGLEALQNGKCWTTYPTEHEDCNIPLYIALPQRQWVGLTVTTILDMMPSAIPAEYDGPLMEFARAVEAKLKERNGY